ncbi:HEPN domain-containing protein [Pyrobaculum sp.]|uniref:HEPN domain-containing protein n=1 Tax=Pyrobaculum sp. TaxID=2004705 RepID=UPI003D0C2EB2
MDAGEFTRWIAMAERTLSSAVGDAERGDFNWACFKAHQAAEFALKALLYGVGMPARGHSLTHLIAGVSRLVPVSEDVVELCRLLDKFYIPTRYVDAWSEGSPFEYFSRRDADAAIKAAEEVIKFVKGVWRSLSGERS